jgi:hypothetical protein
VLSMVMILPIAAPLFASGEQTLPACCRRDGKHHCALSVDSTRESSSAPSISSTRTKCPQFPQTMGVTVHQVGLGTSAAVFAEIISHPAVSPQALSNYRVSLVRSHQKRGPPSNLLS